MQDQAKSQKDKKVLKGLGKLKAKFKEQKHFKRNLLALTTATVLLTVGGAASLSAVLSYEFDLKIEEFTQKLSNEKMHLSYSPRESGWLFFKKEGVFTLTTKAQDGTTSRSELELEAYVLPDEIVAQISIPLNDHKTFSLLREAGIEKVFVDASWDHATLRFESNLKEPIEIKSRTLSGTFSTNSILGRMEIPYEGDKPLGLTLGSKLLNFEPDFLPGMGINLEEFSYTAPFEDFLNEAPLSQFSILQTNKIKAVLGGKSYEFKDLSYEQVLDPKLNQDAIDFKIAIGPDGRAGEVQFKGKGDRIDFNKPKFNYRGEYDVNLLGPVFTKLENELFKKYIDEGMLTKTEQGYTTHLDIKPQDVRLNGKKFNSGNALNPFLNPLPQGQVKSESKAPVVDLMPR